MMERPPITLSVVTYHTEPAVLAACLESIAQITLPFVCMVVDNSQSARIKEQTQKFNDRFPAWGRLEYISHENIGYGRAHNSAIKKVLAEQIARFHLVMNPDIAFERGTIEALVAAMNREKEIGLLSPRFVFPDGKPQRLCKLLPTPGHLLARRFFPGLAKKSDSLYQLECADDATSFDCPSLSGCFMFLRTEALRQVGLFDERFFMYFEDVDLVRRIGQKYRTVYDPRVAVIHHYQKGSYSNPKLLLNHLVSAVKYFNKWGWFWDAQREEINRQTVTHLQRRG
jgi:GT2 family glycosyltransferase